MYQPHLDEHDQPGLHQFQNLLIQFAVSYICMQEAHYQNFENYIKYIIIELFPTDVVRIKLNRKIHLLKS